MITTIIFDIGGVLLRHKNKDIDTDIMRANATLFNVPLQKFVKETKNWWEEAHKNNPTMITLGKRFNKKYHKKISPQDFSDFNKVLQKKLIPRKTWNHVLLKRIKTWKKHNIVAFSNAAKPNASAVRETATFLKSFDKVFFSSELKVRKPNVNSYQLVLKKLRKKPSECIFIDDRLENIKGAKKAGLKIILFKNNKDFFSKMKKLDIS